MKDDPSLGRKKKFEEGGSMISKLQHVLEKRDANALLNEVNETLAALETELEKRSEDRQKDRQKIARSAIDLHDVLRYLRHNRTGEFDEDDYETVGKRLLAVIMSK